MLEFLGAMFFSGAGIAALVLGYLAGNVLGLKTLKKLVGKALGGN